MIKTYFVDGDKGGVGKSFTARAIADMLMQSERFKLPTTISRLLVVDADESNQDVCGPGGFPGRESVGTCEVVGKFYPISSPEQWVKVGDKVFEIVQQWNDADEGRVVFSLPAGAGLAIAKAAEVTAVMAALNAVHVWVMGTDAGSVEQLQARIGGDTDGVLRARPLFIGQQKRGFEGGLRGGGQPGVGVIERALLAGLGEMGEVVAFAKDERAGCGAARHNDMVGALIQAADSE